MHSTYIIIKLQQANMISDIKNALGDNCDPYLQKLIEHFLEGKVDQFLDAVIQNEIAALIEKHDIDVR